MDKSNIVISMKEYATNKKIGNLLKQINPLLTQNDKNIRIHLEALKGGVITEEEFKIIEAKMELGKLCLGLEEIIPNSFATLLFYMEEENKIYHGAAPNIPLHHFDFFCEINEKQLFHEMICGRAVATGEIIFSDIFKDPSCIHERHLSYERGFQSVWSIPFYKGESPVGSFAMYQTHRTQPTCDQIQQAEQKVMEYQEYLALLSEKMHTYKGWMK